MDNDYRRIINTHLQAIRVILSDAEVDELTKLITNRNISEIERTLKLGEEKEEWIHVNMIGNWNLYLETGYGYAGNVKK